MEIDKIEKIHSIGYRLKDAKVTVNQDFKFNVAGIQIEGKQGEVNNMPRWLGKIFSENNLGILDSPDMITELKQALSKEKMVGEYQLSTLDLLTPLSQKAIVKMIILRYPGGVSQHQ